MKFLISSLFIALFIGGCANNPNQFNNNTSFTAQQAQVEPNHLNYDSTVIKNVRNADYTGSYSHTSYVYQNLNSVIDAIADQLFVTNIIKNNENKIMLTSFVDLGKLNKTTTFGRLVGESMFNELHIRKFKVADIRGQNAVSINANGEFHITRDIKKLKKHIEGIDFILVGTYVKFENNSVLVNARILDSLNGDVISSARIVYKPQDCKLFDICQDTQRRSSGGIDIVTDYCSQVGCPNQSCKNGICDNSSSY